MSNSNQEEQNASPETITIPFTKSKNFDTHSVNGAVTYKTGGTPDRLEISFYADRFELINETLIASEDKIGEYQSTGNVEIQPARELQTAVQIPFNNLPAIIEQLQQALDDNRNN